jgi:salicylate hydroxylase
LTKPHVVVVGAGIGGLAATLALLQRGFDVDVYEQAPELKEVGAGVSISANGSAVLLALGLEARLRACSVSANHRELRLWSTGESWALYRGGPPSEQRYGYPSFTLHRVDLHGMLIDAVQRLKPNAVHLDRRCVALERSNGGASISFADGARVTGDVLLGADGIHSRIRHELYGPAKPRFTGQVAWRGVSPTRTLPASLQKIAQLTWIGPSAHISCYPVRSGELFNFVGQVDRDDWQVESWIAEGSVEECLADFAGWHPDVKRLIENNDKLYKWALFLRDPLPHWTSGRVTLLGDACHSMLPYLGQGANSALEDALVLARCLEAFASDPAHALRRYEEARLARTTRIVEASTEMARTFHNPALARMDTAEKYIAEQWHPDKVRSRYDWIYGYDASTVRLD